MTHVVNSLGADGGGRSVLDYTTMRVGTALRRWRGRIMARVATCPECGRNGAREQVDARLVRPFVRYVHRVSINGVVARVEDWCVGAKETEALRMHAGRALSS